MGGYKRALFWARIGCVAGSVAALALVLRRLDLKALGQAFVHLRPGWFIAALAVNGAIFLPAAWRWHISLRLVDAAVHPGASMRLTLIGHFFYTLLFGAVGGDTAKSAVYAKWYRIPFAQVLAAAPFDRFFGFAGLIIFCTAALILGDIAGAFSRLPQIGMRVPGPWAIGSFLFVVALFAALWRTVFAGAWTRFSHSVRMALGRLRQAKAVALSGVACGLLVQAGLSSVLAFNLQAVSPEPLPLLELIWTFQVIIILSALPISFAGLGVREGLAMILLGLYGVAPASAVDAALLTFICGLFWAAVGALLLWSEQRRQQAPKPAAASLSVIIPTLNETGSLRETVEHVRRIPEVEEIVVVDGGSTDNTRALATELGCRVIQAPAGRGGQLRRGAETAAGDVIVLLHADTWLAPECGKAIRECLRDAAVVGGGFWKVFRNPSFAMRGSRLRCALRWAVGRRFMGDQAMFVRRDCLKEVGGVPDMPLMEEFELCRRLRRIGRLALADATVSTSARRFAKLGVVRTYWRMWWVTVRYRFGTAPAELRRLYEKE